MELKLTPEQAAKVAAKKSRYQKAKIPIDFAWFFVAEFGAFYGWEGVKAILNNKIDIDTANYLLLGARKVRNQQLVEDGVVMQTAMTSALNGKKAKDTFQKGMKQFIEGAKISG